MKLFALYGDLTLAATNFNQGVEAAKAQMQGLQGQMNGLQEDATKTGGVLDTAFGHALGDILSGITQTAIETAFTFARDGVELAASMEETNAKIDTIFGDSAENIHRWAKTTKESYGIGELSAKTYAAQVAGIISTDSKNLTAMEIEEISTSLVELAGDLASFHNMDFSETWTKLLSGLRGETEAIEALGVDLRAANLAEAFGMTSTEWGNLDQRTRLLNTYQYIMQETALAQGDFARTSDSYANQLRQLEENIQELKTSFGESLLPVMTELVGWFNSLFGSQEEAAESVEDFSSNVTTSYADIALTTGKALALVEALDELSASTEDAASTDMWNAILTELKTVIPGIGELVDDNTGKIAGGTEALKAYVEAWRTSAQEMARTSAIKSYYDQYTQMERSLWDLQIDQQINQSMIEGMTASVDTVLAELAESIIPYMSRDYATAENVAYLRSDEGLQEIYDALSMGDWDAVISGTGYTLETMIEAAGAIKEFTDAQLLISQYEAQIANLPNYEAEIEEQKAQIEAYQKRLDALEQIVNQSSVLTAQTDETSIIQQALEGASKQAPQPVNIALNVTLDGQDISAALVPSVTGAVMGALDWQIQTKAGG